MIYYSIFSVSITYVTCNTIFVYDQIGVLLDYYYGFGSNVEKRTFLIYRSIIGMFVFPLVYKPNRSTSNGAILMKLLFNS